MTYGQLRQGLLQYFGGEKATHVRALQRLRQKTGDLLAHNTKFSCEAAAASSLMSPLWAKELYINSLHNVEVRKQLRGFLHLSLQEM